MGAIVRLRYDDNNRLISATPPNPVPDQPAGGDYGYDWVGNRLNPPTGSNHMVYNKADQLTTWPGMHTYAYYGDGGLHQVKDASGTNVLRGYTYTYSGLLDTASYNGRTLSNTWDAAYNRVSFTADSTTHTFVYDTTAGIPAVIDEDGVYYVREPEGSLICRISGANTNYYHFDALGSTRLLTDGDGDITDKYAYDAYGSLISHDEYAGSVDQPYQYVGELGYYTHYQEPDFGLLQLGVRFYDADVGRFSQKDPSADGLNSYEFASSCPVIYADPLGLAAKSSSWYKKAMKCASKAFKKCTGKTKDYDKCYWKEFAKCMGKSWSKLECETNVCSLRPKATYCENGNACDRWNQAKGPSSYCQGCCDLKRDCCILVKVYPILWDPPAANMALAACNNESTGCHIMCDCK